MFKHLVAATLLLVFQNNWLAGLAASELKATKIKVVIVDGQNNHNWKATTPYMKELLKESGRFKVSVSTSPQGGKPVRGDDQVAFPPDLDNFDVVLSNYNGAPWPVEFQKALEDRLQRGKVGLVIVHAANNSFENWKEYNRMIGMGWRGNGFGDRLTLDANGNVVRVPKGHGPGAGHGAKHAFQVTIHVSNHPITRDMPLSWMHTADELYHGLRGPIEHVHLLATAYSEKKSGGTGEQEPMMWTVAYGKGRVFHTPMGHDLESMHCVGFGTVLERGSEWAATGMVTIPLPVDFPTVKKTSANAIK